MSKKALDLAKSLKDRSTILTMMGIGLQYHGKSDVAQKSFSNAIRANSRNDQANFMFIRPHLAKLARNTASMEVTQSAAALSSSSAQAVVKGWKYGITKQWQKIAEIDTLLAQTRSTDSWLPQATKIRLDWRLLQRTTQDNKELGREIMSIADEVLLFYPTPELFIQRATGALIAEDNDAFVTTISAMLNIIEQKIQQAKEKQYSFTLSEKAKLQNRLNGIKVHFEKNNLMENGAIANDTYGFLKETIKELSNI